MTGRSALTRLGRPRLSVRTAVGCLGLVMAVCAAIGVAAHYFGPVSTVVTLFAAFTPLFVVLGAVATPMLVAARYWYPALAATVVVLVGAASQLPLYVGDAQTATDSTAPMLRVLQANIMLGEADAAALAHQVRAEQVDVLTVAELTGSAVERLAAAGVERSLPYTYLMPRQGGGGEGIYSRHPLTDAAKLSGLQHNNLRATVHVPGGNPVAVYALHPVPPYPLPAWRWALELDRLGAALAAEPMPLIVGADFNSTYDHERYRNLVDSAGRDGAPLLDAAEYLGVGIVPTYPAGRWFPAVLAIDRILIRGATPTSLRRVDIPGSDHHGLIADVHLTGIQH